MMLMKSLRCTWQRVEKCSRPLVLQLRSLSDDTKNVEQVICVDTSGLGKPGYTPEEEEEEVEVLSKKRAPSPLAIELSNQIKTRGPISVHEYMRQCLMHPSKGYYTRAQAEQNFGERGDFVTAPEISQLFGELLSVWLVNEWRQLGKPPQIRLVEMGPGRGTLMADILRATRAWPSFRLALRHIELVEPSPSLRASQQRELKAKQNKSSAQDQKLMSTEEWHLPQEQIFNPNIRARWHETLASVPSDGVPCFVLAQEVLDAMPGHQFVMTETGDWREKLVDVDDDPLNEDRFRFVLAPTATPASHALLHSSTLKNMTSNMQQNQTEKVITAEVSPSALAVVDEVARRIAASGGGALFIDYGRHSCLGDTLRAFYRHEQLSPLCDPGLVDLTIDVDFQACGRQAAKVEGAAVFGGLEQGEFLGRMGIVERPQALLNNDSLTDDDIDRMITACETLCHADQMGSRYKVLAIVQGDHEQRQTPAGFIPEDRVRRPTSHFDIIAP